MMLIVRSIIITKERYLQKNIMGKLYAEKDKKLLKKIGNRIRILRGEVGLSQEKLAFASGLDRSYIGSVERGERNIAIINLSKIASSLNISISELLQIEK